MECIPNNLHNLKINIKTTVQYMMEIYMLCISIALLDAAEPAEPTERLRVNVDSRFLVSVPPFSEFEETDCTRSRCWGDGVIGV